MGVQALVDSAIDFCEKTHVVQLTTSASNLKAGTFEYDIDLPSYTGVAQVLRAWYGNSALALVAQQDVNSPLAYNASAGVATRRVGPPQLAIVVNASTLTLFPTPAINETGVLAVRVATKPTRAALFLDDLLFEDWIEGVVAGAAYRLASMPGEAYSSDSNAMKYASMYRYHLGCARIESSKGRVRGDMTIQMRPFT